MVDFTFVDNYFKVHSLRMTLKDYYAGEQYARKNPVHKKKWNTAEQKERANMIAKLLFKDEKYKKVIKLAREEWLLSTDGVVKALHYKALKIRILWPPRCTLKKEPMS
jgi:hypothetical protein